MPNEICIMCMNEYSCSKQDGWILPLVERAIPIGCAGTHYSVPTDIWTIANMRFPLGDPVASALPLGV